VSVEVEKKYLLTSDEYYALSKSHFEGAIIQEQLNYYFDSLDFSLLKRGIKADSSCWRKKRKVSLVKTRSCIMCHKSTESRDYDTVIREQKYFYMSF